MSDRVNVLFDLNIDDDCTNLASLAVLNILANQGKARMLATTICFKDPLAVGCVRAINEFYGHGDVPIGLLHCQEATHPTPFMAPVNAAYFPGQGSGQEAPDTVEVMRRALAAEEDESVTLAVSGCFASVAALLKSGPDEISPLSGQELADRKITRMVIMAGQFPTFADKAFPENNVCVQVPAAQYVVAHWTKELVFTGYEIGIRIRSLKEFKFHGDLRNPLCMIYRLHHLPGRSDGGNPSWDQTAVMEAVEPGKYFTYHESGRVNVDDEGYTVWVPEEGGRHTYLLPKGDLNDVRDVINGLIFPEWRQFAD